MMEQISTLVVEVKEMYKRQICWSNSSLFFKAPLLPLRLTATMKNTVLFFVTAISLGLTKRDKPVLPARIPATSLKTSDTACPANSLIDEEVRKTITILDTETWFRPCDCGGPGWEKIAFYDFSQQECPLGFTRVYGRFNNVSCQVTANDICNRWTYYYSPYYRRPYYISSLPLPVEGRSYSNVCGRVRGHGWGEAFYNAIAYNYSLEQPYVSGVSLTHGPAGRRSHIWTFAAANADGNHVTNISCGCSNTNMNWTYATPDDVGHDYFCDSIAHYTEGGRWKRKDDNIYDDNVLWHGEGCDSSSSCCEFNDPPYFCKHLHNTISEDMEFRLFLTRHSKYFYPTVSLIEIFVK